MIKDDSWSIRTVQEMTHERGDPYLHEELGKRYFLGATVVLRVGFRVIFIHFP